MRLKELWRNIWGSKVSSGGCNTPVASIHDHNKRVPAHNEEVPPLETSSSGLPAAIKTSPNKQSHPISQQNHPKSQSNHSRICYSDSSICNENDTFKNNVSEIHRNKEARCLTDMDSTQSDRVPHNDRLSQTECVDCELDRKPKAESDDRTSHNDIATQIDRTSELHHRPPSYKSHNVLKDMGALMEDLCRLLHLKRQTAHPSRLNRLTKSNHNFLTFVLLHLLVPAIIISLLASPVSASLSPTTDYVSQNDTGVCSSMDIRNTPKMFEKLKSCRVIEGFLRISLFDHHNESSFVGLTFPELTEITGYLLLYRVHGIKTLGNWFPNLAVIRGHKLLNNFALVVYEVMDLEEIGLYSLTDVSRGAVRIEKNFNLCYVNTIDWGRIVHTGKDVNFFGENKLDNECPMCPQDDGGTTIGATMTRLCPVSSGSEDYIKKYHCWNANHCQKICRNDCPGRTCYDNGDCCAEECLGGCHGPKDNCTVCKDLSFGDGSQRKCLSNCPPNTFKHQDRRCITESACRSIERPNEMDKNTTPLYPYKPVEGLCVIECPPKFHEVKNNSVFNCVPCQDACTKECSGSNVDSIQAAQRLRGCTYIKGSLEISVRGGGNIVKELEEGLGLITDIVGSLKVARSYPLISLSFLKSLRRIHGLEGSNKVSNALTVTDNQNLQDLWDFEQHGPIEILNGKLFFHFNPKLCLEKIEPLRSMTKDTNFSDQEVALNSNGDKIACNVTLLNITVDKKTENSVLISWAPYVYEDARSLLGYVVYFTEAPYKNVTLYEGRDACGGDGWHVDDVQDMAGDNNSIYHFIPHLKPYTQYAIYVKTYTIATERVGAQSNIIYMKTLPGEPSPPRIVDVLSPEPNVLTLHWLPPEFPNGNVTQYIVTVQWEEDSESLLKQRNYCVEPLVISQPEKKLSIQPETPVKETTPSYDHNAQCSCDSSGFPKEEEYVNQITFEDYLQNMIYQKKGNVDYNRRRRDVNQMETDEFSLRLPMDQPIQPEFTTNKTNGFYIRYKEIVENQTSLNITSLHHYAAHHITIQACREIDPSELESKDYVVNSNCSHKTTFRQRTARLFGADEITGLTIKIQANSSTGIARIEWIEPKQPNSIILTYHIQYKREDSENAGIASECITRQEYNKTGAYIIKNLNPGNYSIRVMATSLAGNGNYSAYKYFYIEESLSNSGTNIIIGCVVGAIGLAVLVGAFFLYRHLQSPAYGVSKLYADVNPEYMSAIYIPDEWEIPRSNIELVKELGQGSFGMVYEGIARDIPKAGKHGKTNCKPEIRCAVKTVNEHATERERSDFLKEASVMKAFDTFHVVRLMGVVSSGLPTLVIMELMANGDLKSYLRSHRLDKEKPTLSRIMQMAMQIADGMAYLSAKKFVHRDLAARNCMVAGDLTVKVGDFGMTRDIYETDYYRKGSKGLLPVRWMSPESLKDGVFTTSSDAWSYGVVLWEMATLATQPYQGLSNDQVVRYVIDGGVMERPENCPDKLYKLMQLTWQHRPAARPTFLQLVALLINDATNEFKENSFFFSEQGQDILKQTQPSTGVVEETSHSMSPTHHNASSRERGAYLGSDSSPIATPRAHTSPISSYREILKSIVPYSEKTKGEPHEMEALVGIIPTKPITMTKMPMKSSSSPTASTAPNGYLMRPSNNGNPTLLSSSHCETLS